MQIKCSFTKKLFPIIVLQLISAVILIVAVLIIKFFTKDVFCDISNFHNKYFERETSVKEVIQYDKSATENEPALSVATVSINKNFALNNSFALPLSGGVKSSGFGYRSDPFTSNTKLHKGIDIAAETGTIIYAAQDGEVSFVGYDEYGFGNYVSIKHTKNLKTLYAHCSEILVLEGEKITKGQPIAKVGNSGVTTGSHLHFEIRLDNVCVNPEWYIDFGG